MLYYIEAEYECYLVMYACGGVLDARLANNWRTMKVTNIVDAERGKYQVKDIMGGIHTKLSKDLQVTSAEWKMSAHVKKRHETNDAHLGKWLSKRQLKMYPW